MRPHGVMFHHFHGGRHKPSQGSIGADKLVEIIEFLGPSRILSAREFLERSEHGRLEPHHICLTFDDNLRCQYDVAAPVLRHYNLTGFWFVATGGFHGSPPRFELQRAFREQNFDDIDAFYAAFERAWATSTYASEIESRLVGFEPAKFLESFPFYTDADRRYRFIRDEVLGTGRADDLFTQMMAASDVDEAFLARDLWISPEGVCSLHASGHVIGLHTHTHPTRVAYLSASEQEREYRDNYMSLMELLAEPPRVMSHPCNSYNDVTLALMRKLGITLGFRSNMELEQHGEYELPREDHANIVRKMAASVSGKARMQ